LHELLVLISHAIYYLSFVPPDVVNNPRKRR